MRREPATEGAPYAHHMLYRGSSGGLGAVGALLSSTVEL